MRGRAIYPCAQSATHEQTHLHAMAAHLQFSCDRFSPRGEFLKKNFFDPEGIFSKFFQIF